MVSVIRCWKAEYQKCKHSILLYMHSLIPIMCAAVFAGYYYISSWEPATKISAYLEVLAVAFPFLIGIIVGLVVQIENQAGHYQLLLGTIPSRMATYIGKLGFLMICAFGATFLALGTFAALYRDCLLYTSCEREPLGFPFAFNHPPQLTARRTFTFPCAASATE